MVTLIQEPVKPCILEHFLVNFDEEWFARQEVFCEYWSLMKVENKEKNQSLRYGKNENNKRKILYVL